MHHPRRINLTANLLASFSLLLLAETTLASTPCDSFKAFPTAVEYHRRTTNCKDDCRVKAAKEYHCDPFTPTLPRRSSQARLGQKELFSDGGWIDEDAAEKSRHAKIDNNSLGKAMAEKARSRVKIAGDRAGLLNRLAKLGKYQPHPSGPGSSLTSYGPGSSVADIPRSAGAPPASADHSSTPVGRPESAAPPSSDASGPSTVSGSSHPELLPRLPNDPVKGLLPDLAQVAKAEADRRLAQRAQRAIERNEPFPMAEAQKANDPEIRRDLESIAIAQQARQEVKEDDVRFTKQIETFEGLAHAVEKNMQGLDTLREADGGQLPQLNAKAEDPAAKIDAKADATDQPAKANLDQDILADVKLEDLSPGELKKLAQELDAEESASDAAGIDPRNSLRSQRRAGLRERLRAMLRARESSVLSDTFEGKISRENSKEGADQENPLLGVISSAFQTANEVTFTMRPAETDAEVNRLVREGQRDIASLSADGVLATDSPALFQRVTLAHRRCEEHRCVRTDRD